MSPDRASARAFLFCVAVAALAPGPWASARAQEASAAGDPLAGDPVDIGVEAQTRSVRAPAAQTTVIDATRFGGEVRSVSELLLAAPGVAVHATGGPGQAATLSLRGASADQSLVLLDGIPLRGPGGGSADLSLIPATLLERLVVSRGVLGAQLGAGALGGALELVPRSARHHASGGVQVSGGSFGSGQLAADLAAPVDRGSLVAAVQLDRTSGGFSYARKLTPEIADAPVYDFDRRNADATRGSGLLRAATRVDAIELDALAQFSAGARGIPGTTAAPTDRPRGLDRGGLLGLRARGSVGTLAWTLRAWGRDDWTQVRGLVGLSDCDDAQPSCPHSTQRSSAEQVEAGIGAATAVGTLLISAGGGAEQIRGDALAGAAGAHDRGVAFLAASDELALPGRVSLHPALRLDHAGRETGLSPALAATWAPWARAPLELRGGAGLSFRPPSFSELYFEQGLVQTNPALTPERAVSVDAGVRVTTGAASFSAGAFWSHFRDLIVYELYPPLRIKPFNVGRARMAGVELEGTLALPQGFALELAYSFLDARNEQAGPQQGQRLPYRAPHRLFARLARRGDRLEGFFESSVTSAMPRNEVDTVSLRAQTVLNAGLGARVAGPLWLDVEVKNLLDDRALEDLFQYPLPGLSLAFIARARL